MPRVPLTRLAHEALAAVLRPGDWAVDATAGNGHDTAFLAHQVGPEGHVWAFDVQPRALLQTASRLESLGLRERCSLIRGSHGQMAEHLPSSALGRVQAVVFNLGYLPGSDKKCITRLDSTLAALACTQRLLAPEGLLSVMAYRGHEGGDEEAQGVARWLEESGFQTQTQAAPGRGPVLLLSRFQEKFS